MDRQRRHRHSDIRTPATVRHPSRLLPTRHWNDPRQGWTPKAETRHAAPFTTARPKRSAGRRPTPTHEHDHGHAAYHATCAYTRSPLPYARNPRKAHGVTDEKAQPTAAEGLMAYIRQRQRRALGRSPEPDNRDATIPAGDADVEKAIAALEKQWAKDATR